MSVCVSCSSGCVLIHNKTLSISPIQIPIRGAVTVRRNDKSYRLRVQVSMVDSSSSDFARRIERAWLISKQPSPIVCTSCNSKGHIECKWCAGTGFFIIGDNMLCEVPSRNTTCIICTGKGSMCCSDCQGTGFRAKWLGEPPTSYLSQSPMRPNKTPIEHRDADAKRRAFHCLPDTRIAIAINATATAERAFFQAWKALTTFLHPLQCMTCLKYLLAKFGACIVPMPPLAGEEADSPATSPAGACSTTA
ncbi:hypothetical protein CR513_38026, partial [Mucuna pruriens]